MGPHLGRSGAGTRVPWGRGGYSGYGGGDGGQASLHGRRHGRSAIHPFPWRSTGPCRDHYDHAKAPLLLPRAAQVAQGLMKPALPAALLLPSPAQT
eukprot:1145429-Pelagomonas_calceolata.AAC.1